MYNYYLKEKKIIRGRIDVPEIVHGVRILK
jgi:hypothetical protein